VLQALGERAIAKIGQAAENAAGGFPGGVRIDDLKAKWKLGSRHGFLKTV
jgi:hypothetical protein